MFRHWLSLCVIVALSGMVGSIVLAQGAAAPKGTKLGAEVKGIFQQFTKEGFLQMDSGGKTVFVKIDKSDRNSIEATAEPNWLQPSLYIKFECEANANGEVKDPIKKMTVLEQSEIESPAFSIDDPTALPTGNKKLTKEEASAFKKYFIRGSIRKVTDDELTIQAASTTVKAKVAPECKIDVQVARIQLAQPGDDVAVKQGTEFPAPAPAGGVAAKPKTVNPKTKGPPAVDPSQARYIQTDWILITARTPLTGKKKPGAK